MIRAEVRSLTDRGIITVAVGMPVADGEKLPLEDALARGRHEIQKLL
jgi:hypothetical protein